MNLSALFKCLCVLLVSGFVFAGEQEKTPEWAQRTVQSTCNEFFGSFHRTPILETPWESSRHQEPSDDLLALIVTDRDTGSDPEESIRLELSERDTLRVQIGESLRTYIDSRCNDDGVVWISQENWQSEERESTELMLWKGENGSLIVRRRFIVKGLGFLHEEITQWLKYRPSPQVLRDDIPPVTRTSVP